ncbi:hypothetical protein ONZ45_g8531 [Pleurotus djamor]|nr:hypothetical protein ONZ45_g8531 [Pleurotus djamor]
METTEMNSPTADGDPHSVARCAQFEKEISDLRAQIDIRDEDIRKLEDELRQTLSQYMTMSTLQRHMESQINYLCSQRDKWEDRYMELKKKYLDLHKEFESLLNHLEQLRSVDAPRVCTDVEVK